MPVVDEILECEQDTRREAKEHIENTENKLFAKSHWQK